MYTFMDLVVCNDFVISMVPTHMYTCYTNITILFCWFTVADKKKFTFKFAFR